MSVTALERNTHGSVFGGLSAIRWIAFSAQEPELLPTQEDLPPDQALFVAPLGFPEPAVALQRWTEQQPGTRPLVISRVKRRLDPQHTRLTIGETQCPVSLPYRWGPLTAEEYREFGIIRGMDIERCRQDRRAPLRIEAQQVAGTETLRLLLSWYDVAARWGERATVRVRSRAGATIPVRRVEQEMLLNLALFEFDPPRDGGFVVELSPLNTLAVVDIY